MYRSPVRCIYLKLVSLILEYHEVCMFVSQKALPLRSSAALHPFLLAHILAQKRQAHVAPDDPGNKTFGIALLQLVQRKIGADDRGPPGHQARIDNIVYGGVDERGGKLGNGIAGYGE